MIILGNIFSIIIFISMIGSIFTILSLIANKLLHVVLPLWYELFMFAFYLIPFIYPILKLIPPEEQKWLYGFHIASMIWIIGMILFMLYFSVRNIMAFCTIKKYEPCDDKYINNMWSDYAKSASLKNVPAVLFGTLKEPACVVTFFHSVLILNRDIIQQLTDKELSVVLCHEITHLQRKHHIYQTIFDVICIIHWFNPFAWVAKSDLDIQCEMDCDSKVLSILESRTTSTDYANVLLRLMQISSKYSSRHHHRLAILGFIFAKQRIYFVLNIPSQCKRKFGIVIMTLFLTTTILFSTFLSLTYFYPYPACKTNIEVADNSI